MYWVPHISSGGCWVHGWLLIWSHRERHIERTIVTCRRSWHRYWHPFHPQNINWAHAKFEHFLSVPIKQFRFASIPEAAFFCVKSWGQVVVHYFSVLPVEAAQTDGQWSEKCTLTGKGGQFNVHTFDTDNWSKLWVVRNKDKIAETVERAERTDIAFVAHPQKKIAGERQRTSRADSNPALRQSRGCNCRVRLHL